ncbi:extracellular solute-binding protein [Paenibacillus sp. GCM10023248]|uniref:extracellular solute-binding protein n=1 Tax=unclassified Paenibacillus TaxID=185978 RepID=UPI002378B63A|nr:extracellular solute-binding protein [Paenibacillus sp. MAHUQ-63]MDD9271913.1 extracellular solute-binding protein [Paenibacillus sp. MAHUQ-63]
MKMNKWAHGSVTLAVALGVLLSGCSSESANNSSDSGGQTDTKQPPKASSNMSATGLPIVKDKVTLKIAGLYGIAGQKPFGELPFFKSLEEKTNVHVDWQMNDANGFKEKKNLMFASGDLPDAFYGHYILDNDEVVKYGYQGLFIPLEELINKYAPNLKKILDANPGYKKDMTAPNGHIYSLPTIDGTYPTSKDMLFVNKKWLDQLKLPIPTTPDEFYKTLKAFKDNDMNGNGKKDEVPFSYRVHAIQGIYSLYGSFGLLDKQDHIIMKGDQVVYTAVQPEYKEATKFFHKLFAEGLVDPESLTHDEKVYGSKLRSKDSNVGSYVAWTASTYMDPDQAANFVPVMPLKGPDGKQIWNSYSAGILSKGAFAITSNNKNPEITMRWIDYMYDPRVSLEAVNGTIGTVMKDNGDGTLTTIDPPSGVNANEFRHTVSPGSTSVFAKTNDSPKVVGKPYEKGDMDKLLQPYLDKNIFPNLYFSEEETEARSRYFTDIDAYVKKMQAKWLVQGGIDEEWDSYVKKLKEMNLDKLVKVYQDAYNRYNAIK